MNNEQPKHSTLPWEIDWHADRVGIKAKNWHVFLITDKGRLIPSVEDTRFIIRACNNYYKLLKALKDARTALQNVPEVGQKYDQQHSYTHVQACLDIEEAIENAEAKP